MAGMTDSLRILITCDGAQAEREFASVGAASRRSLGMAENNAQRYSRTLTSAGVAMASFGASALAGLGKAAQAAEEEHAALLRLENSIQNMPELAGATTDAFLEQAAALQDSTRFADDATVSAQAMLGTFHLTEQQILDLIPAVQDYAAKFGVDLVTASKQVGRAVSGSAGALQRNGIIMDEAAFSADSYSETLRALRENAGGFAAQEAQTLSGQLEILKNNMMDVVEAVGGGAASAFSTLLGPVNKLSEGIQGLNPETQDLLGRWATFGAVGLTAAGAFSFVGGQAINLSAKIKKLSDSTLILRGRLALLNVGGAGFAGVAAGAVLAGFAIAEYSRAQDKAARISNFAEALKAEAEGFDDATEKALAHVLATDGAINNYDELGISAETIVDAIKGESGAWEELQQARSDAEAVMNDNDLHNPAIEQQAMDIKELVRNVGLQRDAYDSANGAQNDFEAALRTTGDTAEDTAQALDDLTQEIQDYLDGVYSLPEAQRAVNDAFDDLFSTLLTEGHSVDDVAESMQGIVEATAGVISAGGDADEVARTSILRLREQKDQGLITIENYQQQREAILNIPGVSRTLFEQPGMADAQLRTIHYRGLVVSVPRNWASTFQANTGSAIGSVQALIDRIHVLNNTVVRPQGGGIGSQIGAISAQIYGHESGTASAPPGLAWVGERGPELMSFAGGERVYTASQSRAISAGASSGGGQVVNLNVTVNGSATKADGQAVVDALQRWSRTNGRVPVKTMA